MGIKESNIEEIKEELYEIQADLMDLTDAELVNLRETILKRIENAIELLYLTHPDIGGQDGIKKEYKSIAIAYELDDVDVSLSTMEARAARLEEIEEEVGEKVIDEWDKEINDILAHPDTIYSSGRMYNGI